MIFKQLLWYWEMKQQCTLNICIVLHLSLLIDQNMMKHIFLLLNGSQGQRVWKCDYFGTKKNIERENTCFTDDFILIILVVIIVIISNLEFIWVSFEYWAKNDLPNLLYDS